MTLKPAKLSVTRNITMCINIKTSAFGSCGTYMFRMIHRISVNVSLSRINRFVLKTGLKIQVVLDVTLCRLVNSCRRFVRE